VVHGNYDVGASLADGNTVGHNNFTENTLNYVLAVIIPCPLQHSVEIHTVS